MRMLPLARRCLATATCSLVLLGAASAQTFPSKPITFVAPFAAGGAADVLARVLGQAVTARLGQPVVVEAKAGAGGSVGAGFVAKAPADGHTLLLVTAGHAGTGALYPSLPFHPVNDFAPIIGIASAPVVIAVNASSKYKTLADLVNEARANPGKLNCAGGGGGATVTNLAFELLKAELKINITAVPYRGSGPAITALMAGEIDCDSDAISSIIPQVNAGKLRVLAVSSKVRSSALPQVPTVAEAVLPGFDASAWFGILAPKGTPPAVVDRLYREFKAALADPQVQARLQGLGADPTGTPPAEFGAFLAGEAQRWGGLIQKLGLKAD